MMTSRCLIPMLAFTLLAACGETGDPEQDDSDEHSYEDLEDEVCTHATEHALSVTASSTIDDVDVDEDDIAETHRHFRTELPTNEDDEHQGFVAFDTAEYGDEEFGVFVSTDVDLTFYGDDGEPLENQPETSEFDACAEIERQHSIELDGGTYFVHFEPAGDGEVSTITETIGDIVQ